MAGGIRFFPAGPLSLLAIILLIAFVILLIPLLILGVIGKLPLARLKGIAPRCFVGRLDQFPGGNRMRLTPKSTSPPASPRR